MRRKGRLKIKRVRKRTNDNSKSEKCALEVKKTKMTSKLAGTKSRLQDKEQHKTIERYINGTEELGNFETSSGKKEKEVQGNGGCG